MLIMLLECGSESASGSLPTDVVAYACLSSDLGEEAPGLKFLRYLLFVHFIGTAIAVSNRSCPITTVLKDDQKTRMSSATVRFLKLFALRPLLLPRNTWQFCLLYSWPHDCLTLVEES